MELWCSIEGCETPIKHKGLCGKHYKRQWRHGDPLKTLCVPKGEGRSHEEKLRVQRIKRYGREHNVVAAKGSGTLNAGGYRLLTVNGRREYEHTLIAEKALGKRLPETAKVHHFDLDPANNAPGNLVVCPDQAYHLLLHRRQRELWGGKGIPPHSTDMNKRDE